jgi:hypothetical protein
MLKDNIGCNKRQANNVSTKHKLKNSQRYSAKEENPCTMIDKFITT